MTRLALWSAQAARLLDELQIRHVVVLLGPVPYDDLPQVYGSAHVVICPAYAESFSHTVVEAMALGVPVIASDIAVHREVAGEAACFFSPFDPDDLADRCLALMRDGSLRDRMSAAGPERATAFSWQRHFQELLAASGRGENDVTANVVPGSTIWFVGPRPCCP